MVLLAARAPRRWRFPRRLSDRRRKSLMSDIRIEEPSYVARYRQRAGGNGSDTADTDADDESIPLYLRQFRNREAAQSSATAPAVERQEPLWKRGGLPVQRALTEDSRNKEIVPPEGAVPGVVNDAYLIRHGETQGYLTDSGLTPQGAWQAHTYGHTMAKRYRSGETVG